MNTANTFLCVLIKQKANLRSNEEAERVIEAVTLCLRANLGKRANRTLELLPLGKVHPQRKFYVKLKKRAETTFNYQVFLSGLVGLLNLTDTIEAEQYIHAFFGSALTLMGEHERVQLGKLLPQELTMH